MRTCGLRRDNLAQLQSRPLPRPGTIACLSHHSVLPPNPGYMCREDHRQPGGMKFGHSGRPYRSSMISPRYRQREERRKMLKISAGKLSRIDDPEASLCRSVLINNTLRRLRKETATVLPQPQPEFAQDVPVDEQEDCEDTAMFCVPPTPSLLTSIDDDDGSSPAKRPREHQEFSSCGQASMLDGAVFHSLMASLETT